MPNVKQFNVNGTLVDVYDEGARTAASSAKETATTASETAENAKTTADQAKEAAEQALQNAGTLSYSSDTETITWTQGGA